MATTEATECPTCSALVADHIKHQMWHGRLVLKQRADARDIAELKQKSGELDQALQAFDV